MTADGAYDAEAVYDAVAERHPEAAVIIPPRATAVPNESAATQRDRHIVETEEHGRLGWQRRSGCSRRSLLETTVYRYKTIGRSAASRPNAGHRPDPPIPAARGETQPAIYSYTKAISLGSEWRPPAWKQRSGSTSST